jgi:carboxymethylenebutenolidase
MPKNPHQNVTFSSNGRKAHGYLKLPKSGRGPGVVVIQEWWGLTDHIVDVCDRFAAEGFVALAPDLYGGHTTHDAGEAGKLMRELPVEHAARDLSGAVDYLLGHRAVTGKRVGAVGFCMGGGFVLVLAAQAGEKIGAAVPFYAVLRDEPDLSGIKATVLGHFGEADRPGRDRPGA